MFCIPKYLVNDFLERVKSGEINPEKMAAMSSKERRDYFATFLGEANAHKVNALFESKLLLQHQQQGMINWAKQVSGLKPEAQRDIIARINKMDRILSPENKQAFLEDLAAQRLGVTVTMEEAGNIAALAKSAAEKKAAITTGGDPVEYGRAKVAFDDYLNSLKEAAKKNVMDYFKPRFIAGLAKSMKASLDNSVIGRQGLKVAFTNPDIWLKNSFQSFKDIWDTFGGKEVLDEVRAEVLSRPNAINGLYRKEGLAVGVREEAYPVHISEKIPGLGKFFKASEAAFTAFQYRTRADIFDRYYDAITAAGGDPKGIGMLANSLTGRGKLGVFEKHADTVNALFFSPRFLKSNIDTLTGHVLDYKGLGVEARKIAALNTLKIVGSVATMLAVARAINPDSVETDPRSSDFGKIRIGDTRFDVSGGMASILTLGARLAFQSEKSSITKLVTELNSGKFGDPTDLDVLLNFLENKASPAASVLLDIAKGKDRSTGGKPTVMGELSNLLLPLPVSNYLELKNNPNSANVLLSMIADELGISTNTYSANANWSDKEGAELKQFHQEVGDQTFQEANKEFNIRFNERLNVILKNKEYQDLSDARKADLIRKEKVDLRDEIFKENNFHYRKEKQERLPKI